MDIGDQVLVVQNPDGTIQIATQPHLKHKKVMNCYQCKIKIVFDAQYSVIKCSKCQAVNQIPGFQPPVSKTVECGFCGRPAVFFINGNLRFARCITCQGVTALI